MNPLQYIQQLELSGELDYRYNSGLGYANLHGERFEVYFDLHDHTFGLVGCECVREAAALLGDFDHPEVLDYARAIEILIAQRAWQASEVCLALHASKTPADALNALLQSASEVIAAEVPSVRFAYLGNPEQVAAQRGFAPLGLDGCAITFWRIARSNDSFQVYVKLDPMLLAMVRALPEFRIVRDVFAAGAEIDATAQIGALIRAADEAEACHGERTFAGVAAWAQHWRNGFIRLSTLLPEAATLARPLSFFH